MTRCEPGHLGANTVEDILGEIWLLQSVPRDLTREETVELLRSVIERVRDKIARSKNRVRTAWFTNAVEFLQQAAEEFAVRGHTVELDSLLRKAAEQVASGNRAHRRKATFIVAPSGDIEPL